MCYALWICDFIYFIDSKILQRGLNVGKINASDATTTRPSLILCEQVKNSLIQVYLIQTCFKHIIFGTIIYIQCLSIFWLFLLLILLITNHKLYLLILFIINYKL